MTTGWWGLPREVLAGLALGLPMAAGWDSDEDDVDPAGDLLLELDEDLEGLT